MLKLGKQPPKTDKRTLKLTAYLTPTLPPPPPTRDWAQGVAAFGMMGNDQFGDCTAAAAGHLEMVWSTNAGKEYTPSDQTILRFYRHFSPAPNDDGANCLEVLNYWRKIGISRKKIRAFAAVNPQGDEVRQAINLFGGLYIGMSLPDSVIHGDLLQPSWEIVDGHPNPDNGHCVCLVGYDGTGYTCVTWGSQKRIGESFFRAYCDEAYALLSPLWFGRSVTCPVGIDLASLEVDLQAVTS